MKKNVLSLSIAAAVAGFGLVGGANAALTFNGDGVGHMLLVPYYTAQAENSTLINLVNTDTTNAKAVKVRFRGAANSDDVFDFQLFLSPGDVYALNVSQGLDGKAKLTTADASCTKPDKTVLNATPFLTTRLDPQLDVAGKANGTREGYVEVFNMADIPPEVLSGVNPLFTAIKHVNKVAPCSGAAWTALDTNDQTNLLPPTSGLTANWTIINIVGAAAWSGKAEAIVANPAPTHTVYWPQTAAPAFVFAGNTTALNVNLYTADPLIAGGVDKGNNPKPATFVAGNFDLPDMSTPYDVAFNTNVEPVNQANALTAAIAATSASNEFLTDPSIQASTDWVFSQPTRRYHVSLDYTATAPDDGRRFSENGGIYYAAGNTLVAARQVCVQVGKPVPTDREESLLTGSTEVVVSPSTPADPLSFCGEATVLSVNNAAATTTTALKANVAVKDLDVTFVDGWMTLPTPGNTPAAGLPVLGSAFVKANAGANSFGAAYPHRVVRP